MAVNQSLITDKPTEREGRNRNRNRRYRRRQLTRKYIFDHKINNLKSYIVNLSSYNLSEAETHVLSKGLGFAPSANKPHNYSQALQNLARSYRLQHYVANKSKQWIKYISPYPFKSKSNWNPPKASPEVEAYLNQLPVKFASIQPMQFHPNMTHSERNAIAGLKNNKLIVIKKADKGSCIVVEDTVEYERAGMEHLSDDKIYEEISHDPTQQLAKVINKLTSTLLARGYIDSPTHSHLTLNEVRTQQLYFLKKLHKNPHGVRPIVSGCSGPTELLSALMDYFLKPLVQHTDSHIKDSKSIVKLLESLTLPKNCILLTIDVKALYLNIPHAEGIQACVNAMYHCGNPKPPFPPQVAKTLLKIVLDKNYFEFAGKMFHQIQGTAMGTKMAPSYANIFMDVLETNFLATQTCKPLMWKRYIDDILAIWNGPEGQLEIFLSELNNYHQTIKFTHSTSRTAIDFLDLTIYKGKRFATDAILDIKPMFKATNSFQYLHYSSAHPRSVFRGIIKGEATRVLRASSDKHTYQTVIKKLQVHLQARGYPKHLLHRCFSEVSFANRGRLLDQNEATDAAQPATPTPPTLVIDFNSNILKKDLRNALLPPTGVPSPRIAFRMGKNISNSLVRALQSNHPSPPTSETPMLPHAVTLSSSSMPCDTQGCRCCAVMSTKDQVFSTIMGTFYELPRNTNCSTQTAIYLLECQQCKGIKSTVRRTDFKICRKKNDRPQSSLRQ